MNMTIMRADKRHKRFIHLLAVNWVFMLLIDLDFQEKDEHDEVWNEKGLIGFGDNLWVSH